MENDKNYVQGHDADVWDVANRLQNILARGWKDKMLMDEPFILASGEIYLSCFCFIFVIVV